jgi:hypothetical protein
MISYAENDPTARGYDDVGTSFPTHDQRASNKPKEPTAEEIEANRQAFLEKSKGEIGFQTVEINGVKVVIFMHSATYSEARSLAFKDGIQVSISPRIDNNEANLLGKKLNRIGKNPLLGIPCIFMEDDDSQIDLVDYTLRAFGATDVSPTTGTVNGKALTLAKINRMKPGEVLFVVIDDNLGEKGGTSEELPTGTAVAAALLAMA